MAPQCDTVLDSVGQWGLNIVILQLRDRDCIG